MPRTSGKFLEFYLLVLKYERVYSTQKRAYIEAEAEWMSYGRTRRYSTWNAFRCNVHQRIKKLSFFIARLRHFEYGLDFVVGSYSKKDECELFAAGIGARIPGCTVTIYSSATGRIDETARELSSSNFNNA